MKYQDINDPQELLDYMKNNFSYGYLDKSGMIHNYDDYDFNDDWYDLYRLENTEDVNISKVGNCFDMTEFEREWFVNHGYEVFTFFEMVNLEYENDFPTHSFLIYRDNNKYYHFEFSDYDNFGIHEYDTLEDALNTQFKTYLDLLDKYGIKEEEKDSIHLYEFDKPKERISAKEYLEHTTMKCVDNYLNLVNKSLK